MKSLIKIILLVSFLMFQVNISFATDYYELAADFNKQTPISMYGGRVELEKVSYSNGFINYYYRVLVDVDRSWIGDSANQMKKATLESFRYSQYSQSLRSLLDNVSIKCIYNDKYHNYLFSFYITRNDL